MKKLLKRIVLLIGTVCLCFLGVSFYGPSREAQAASYSVSTYAQLMDACSKPGNNTVTLTSDITLSGAVTIKNSCNITLNGNGKVIRPSNAANCFEIQRGGKLTVSNLTVDRSNNPNGNVFFVGDGGALVVNGGTYKAGNGSAGVGSSVINAKGMATINGGTFSGSNQDFYAVTLAGAYPYVINGGTFTDSTSGVGVNLDTSGTQSLTINNGNFHNNANNGITVGNPTLSQAGTTTVTINGGNFYNNGLNGVSVCYANQTCNVKAANIYNNKQAGVLGSGSKVNFTSTNAGTLKVYDNGKYNVGVFESGVFTGGYADLCNTAYMDNRGILVQGATATVGAGTTIKNCLDGIYVNSSSTAVVNGGLISGCKRGIWIYSSTCTINNVEVDGNTTGIDADSVSTLTMSAGKIVNNTTGLYVEGTGKATLAGSSAGAIVIAGNSENGIKTAHSAILNASNISVYSGGGYNAQPVGLRLNSSKDASISGSINSHTDRGIISNTTGTVTVGGTINNNYVGVEVLKGTLKSSANIHTNSYGLYETGGVVNVSGGNIYSNGSHAFYISGGTLNMTSANVYNNTNGVYVLGNATANLSGSSSGAIKVMGNGAYGVYFKDTASGSISNANIYGGNGYNAQAIGVSNNSSGTVTINGNVNVYGHQNGVGAYAGTTNSAANIYSNTNNAIAWTGTLNLTGGTIKNGTYGLVVKENGKATMSNATITANTTAGVYVEKGTLTHNSGSIDSNTGYGVYIIGSSSVYSMANGSVSKNGNYGVYAGNSSRVTISGGNVASNGGAYGDVYDAIRDFTLTGTYSGRSSVNGYVYLVLNDNYVKTVSSSTLIKIRPSTYYSGRVVINTSSASYAATQERSTLYPNSNWILKKNGVNVVLARVPSIYYNNTEITDTLTLGWYNADTISGMGKFTAKDPDNDLSSFIMKYEGQTVATGTKDSAGVMHLDYDFKIEGIREYTLTATDSLGNSVTRTVIVMVDLTPPSIIDVPDSNPDDEPDDGNDDEGSTPDDGSGDEPDDENGGEGSTYTWTVVIVEPDATIEQQGEDMLSGVANISVSKFSEQDVFIKKIYDAPYRIKVSLADYPDERGVVIKVVDKAGNAAYKCVLDKSKLEIKIEPFYPTK